ncbi:YNL330Cp-like protein [Conidiobolus coronatus NRRL 28638]|uniref:Histone deacetylase n=1 Tax=Conidiobolus coronatus (strain ATCC 28846 / CBS 209.66 / NRRL 28638) TaxID=796925 RepID=A0A137P7G2_CONC2|nr:YNL330Cp-like protein [Conidiobolus coronatus NRRL 28638]|eukprot:KXN70957.1 YNL330Cp-like protein [Conidiobolus coronatus NRRL 28638]
MGYNKSRVAYCYDENIGNYHYGPGHPMKPLRVKMCHNLVMNYDLFKHLNIIEHKPASKERLTQYHSEDYINFLEKINPKNAPILRKNFNVGEDCPVFEGIYDYNALAAGGTIEAVAQLNHNKADIAINWSGGLHHAKRCEASGFCYVNDIVLGILELLRYHPKVLYIDIDVHHGDGVEEAFFATDRVMTLSFHKFGEFFPGTGDLRDIGYGEGKYHSINVPLRSGIDDNTFQQIFEPVTRACIEWYNPSAIVLQCGADSLAGDRLGCFNLSATGHSNCVKFVKSLNLPMLVLGGGGYTVRNVARCWTKETGVILNQELDNKLPVNDYYDFYGPEYQLEVEPVSIENLNTKSYIQSITEKVINNIRRCQINPNVQLHGT